ncbi:DnaB-like helicase N-terminal domain-containing protein [Leptospirillum ferriphilum]|nr:DnaB-like helicase N-terminal domain-containing protein [Leptospirillum ferriphilum]
MRSMPPEGNQKSIKNGSYLGKAYGDATRISDIVAEKTLISCIFLDPDFLDTSFLTGSDFVMTAHILLFGSMREMRKKGAPITVETLWDCVGKSLGYPYQKPEDLAGLLEVSTTGANAPYWAWVVKEKAFMRAAMMESAHLLDQILAHGIHGTGVMEEIVDRTRDRLEKVLGNFRAIQKKVTGKESKKEEPVSMDRLPLELWEEVMGKGCVTNDGEKGRIMALLLEEEKGAPFIKRVSTILYNGERVNYNPECLRILDLDKKNKKLTPEVNWLGKSIGNAKITRGFMKWSDKGHLFSFEVRSPGEKNQWVGIDVIRKMSEKGGDLRNKKGIQPKRAVK